MREQKKDGFKAAGHDKPFSPTKDPHKRVKADFDHKTDLNERKKNFKDEDGKVKIEPPNFLTNPPKKGQVGKGTTFEGVLPYKPDPYDHKKELAKKELEEHKAKCQEKPFSQKVRPKGNFSTDLQAYGEDVQIPARKPKPARPPLMTHDHPFKPSHPPKKDAVRKTISAFPPYKEDPPKPVVRKQKAENEEERPRWRPTHNEKTRPAVSVTTMTKNLRCEFPSVFKRGV